MFVRKSLFDQLLLSSSPCNSMGPRRWSRERGFSFVSQNDPFSTTVRGTIIGITPYRHILPDGKLGRPFWAALTHVGRGIRMLCISRCIPCPVVLFSVLTIQIHRNCLSESRLTTRCCLASKNAKGKKLPGATMLASTGLS